jgi:U3 small nucleolar ribonucleoprotein protein LCP5
MRDDFLNRFSIYTEILLNYCTNILFYLLLKTEGKQVKDHPVIDHLVKLRVVLEKIQPLEQKIKYQVDKLIKATSLSSHSHALEGRSKATGLLFDVANSLNVVDPLHFKPNIDHIIDGDEERSRLHGEDRDMEDSSHIYKPPRLAATPYDETNTSRDKRQEDVRRMKASRGRLLKDLQEEFSVQPEEMQFVQADDADDDTKLKERYEEDHFVRLSLSKKDQMKRKKQQQLQTLRNEDFEVSRCEARQLAKMGCGMHV